MDNMHTDLPKTINEALKILAYNDYFWANPSMLGNTGQLCLDRETGKTGRGNIEKVPDKISVTWHGHK